MPILSEPSFGPRTALAYVTGGALIDVWTLVWYFTREAPLSPTGQFWVIGLVLTGLTFVILGLFLGPLGRSARQAELPPAEAIQAEANIQATAAANPPAVVAPGIAEAPLNHAAMSMPAVAPPAPPGVVFSQPRVG
ncbi:MAG: hypothetical protein C0467_08710 [Planctomycetaceae bacterium]|nr:hypothetical protein [Planctomycetaceae bacterium]